MERHDKVFALVLAPGKANVPNHANKATSWDKSMEAGSPNLVQLVQEGLVVSYVTHLPLAHVVAFQSPVGRRGNNKMDTFRAQKLNTSRVSSMKVVLCRKLLQFCFYRRDDPRVLGDSREIGLMIGYRTDLLEEEFGWIEGDV
jgi:hypothetical protein